MISVFKTGSILSDLRSEASPKAQFRVDPGLFSEAEESDHHERPARMSSSATVFAEHAARTFETSLFQSRTACLRQVMKCVASAELANDPMQAIESIHAQRGAMVLEIVQVFMVFLGAGLDEFELLQLGVLFVMHFLNLCCRERNRLFKVFATPSEFFLMPCFFPILMRRFTSNL